MEAASQGPARAIAEWAGTARRWRSLRALHPPPLSNPGPAGGGVWRRPQGCSRASNCEELRAHQHRTLTTSACRFACDAVVWPVPQSPAAERCHHVRDDLEHARWQRCERRRERCAAEHTSITANEHLKPLQETV